MQNGDLRLHFKSKSWQIPCDNELFIAPEQKPYYRCIEGKLHWANGNIDKCLKCCGLGYLNVHIEGELFVYPWIVNKNEAELWLLYLGKTILKAKGESNHLAAKPSEWSPILQAIDPFVEALTEIYIQNTLPKEIKEQIHLIYE